MAGVDIAVRAARQQTRTIHPSCVVQCDCDNGYFNGPLLACDVTAEERDAAISFNSVATIFLDKSLAKMETSVENCRNSSNYVKWNGQSRING